MVSCVLCVVIVIFFRITFIDIIASIRRKGLMFARVGFRFLVA